MVLSRADRVARLLRAAALVSMVFAIGLHGSSARAEGREGNQHRWAVTMPYTGPLPAQPWASQQTPGNLRVVVPVRVEPPLGKEDVSLCLVPFTPNIEYLMGEGVIDKALYNAASGHFELYFPSDYFSCSKMGASYSNHADVPYFLRSRLTVGASLRASGFTGASLLIPRLATNGTYVAPDVSLVRALLLSARWADGAIELKCKPDKNARSYVFQLFGQPVKPGWPARFYPDAPFRFNCMWETESTGPDVRFSWAGIRAESCLDLPGALVSLTEEAGRATGREGPTVGTFHTFKEGFTSLSLYARAEAWDVNQNLDDASPFVHVADLNADDLRGCRVLLTGGQGSLTAERLAGPHPKPTASVYSATMFAGQSMRPAAAAPSPSSTWSRRVKLSVKCADPLPIAHIWIQLYAAAPSIGPRSWPYVFWYDPEKKAYLSDALPGGNDVRSLQVVSDVPLDHWYFARSRLKRPQEIAITGQGGQVDDLGAVDLVRALSLDCSSDKATGDVTLKLRSKEPAATSYSYSLWLCGTQPLAPGESPSYRRPGAPKVAGQWLVSDRWLIARLRTSDMETRFAGKEIAARLRSGWTFAPPYVQVEPPPPWPQDKGPRTIKVKVVGLEPGYRLYLYAGVEAWDKNDDLVNTSPVYRIRTLPDDALNGLEMEEMP